MVHGLEKLVVYRKKKKSSKFEMSKTSCLVLRIQLMWAYISVSHKFYTPDLYKVFSKLIYFMISDYKCIKLTNYLKFLYNLRNN